MIGLNPPANSSLPDKIDQINSIFAALILLQNTPLKQGVTDATSPKEYGVVGGSAVLARKCWKI